MLYPPGVPPVGETTSLVDYSSNAADDLELEVDLVGAHNDAVEALSSALGLVEMGLPFLLGIVADTVGLAFALVLIVTQPLAIVVLAIVDPRDVAAPGETDD